MPDDPAPSVPLRRAVLLVLVMALVAGVPAALWWRGSAATGQVTVATGLARCEGTEAATLTTLEGEGFVQDAISMVEGFRCTVTVRISNSSSREVDLGRFVVPLSGPGGGAGMEITRIGGVEIVESDETDAFVDLDRPLGSGGEAFVDLEVQFRSSGCTSRGGRMSLTPTLDVSDLLATRPVQVADLPVFLGTADTSCGNRGRVAHRDAVAGADRQAG